MELNVAIIKILTKVKYNILMKLVIEGKVEKNGKLYGTSQMFMEYSGVIHVLHPQILKLHILDENGDLGF